MESDDELYERIEWLEDDIETLHEILEETVTQEDLDAFRGTLENLVTQKDLEKAKGDLTWRFVILIMSFLFGIAAIVAAVFTALSYFSQL